MVKIVWTTRALIDLQEIAEYISRDSFQYAVITLEKLMEASVFLEVIHLSAGKSQKLMMLPSGR
jgi:plasmid stabilization system protein ParE